jgi:hypothetical protein
MDGLLIPNIDYKRTQKVLATCPFCYGEDDSPPKAPVIAMGTRAYLCRTINEELLDGHCLIVPIQHHLSMLEADDDVWDEVRVRFIIITPNFHRGLMNLLSELHEVSHAHVRRRRQRPRFLRNSSYSQAPKAHVH